MTRAVRGDFGQSIRAMRPVLPYVLERLPATLELSLGAFLLAAGLGFPSGCSPPSPLGVGPPVAQPGAPRPVRAQLLDRADPHRDLLGQAPRAAGVGPREPPHLILPSITLAIFFVGLVVRLTRSGMLEVLTQDYVRTAWSKGLPARLVIFRHALKNAMIPIVTVLGLQVGTLLGGAVVTETVFAWPGMGQLAVQAIAQRDYPVVQAIVLLLGLAFVLINWAVDVSYGLLDPRIHHG